MHDNLFNILKMSAYLNICIYLTVADDYIEEKMVEVSIAIIRGRTRLIGGGAVENLQNYPNF